MNIRKATVTVTVLYDGDTYTPENVSDWNLDAINYNITEGDCIGEYGVTADDAIPTDQVRQALLAVANDGTFFHDIDADDFDPLLDYDD